MTRTTMTDRTSRVTKMRLFSLVRVAVLGALLSGASVARAAPDSVATIKALVEQGQFERAYDHALAAEARYEGDPEFDFYFGLAAIAAHGLGEDELLRLTDAVHGHGLRS